MEVLTIAQTTTRRPLACQRSATPVLEVGHEVRQPLTAVFGVVWCDRLLYFVAVRPSPDRGATPADDARRCVWHAPSCHTFHLHASFILIV